MSATIDRAFPARFRQLKGEVFGAVVSSALPDPDRARRASALKLCPIPPLASRLVSAFDRIPADDWEQFARVLDANINDLSAEQQALAVERASRRVGVAGLDTRDEEHLRIVWDELRAAALRALLNRLVTKGDLEVAGVADSGQLLYRRPPGMERS